MDQSKNNAPGEELLYENRPDVEEEQEDAANVGAGGTVGAAGPGAARALGSEEDHTTGATGRGVRERNGSEVDASYPPVDETREG